MKANQHPHLSAVPSGLLAMLTAVLLQPLASAEDAGHYLVVDPVPDPSRAPVQVFLRTTPEPTIYWRGQAILLSAPKLDGPWVGIAKQSRYRFKFTESQRFYRAVPAVRPVEVYVPPSYEAGTPAPLIISLHGYRLEPEFQESLIPMKSLADERGFIYCLPRGEVNQTGATQWNGADCCGIYGSTRDDVAFLAGLVNVVSEQLSVDPQRVYLVGHSNGAFMAYRAACERADLFAAIVSLAGATYYEPSDCAPTEPVSVLEIHGTADEAVAYGGGLLPTGEPLPSAHETIARWADYNGCHQLVEDTDKSMNLDLNVQGLDATASHYANGPPGIDVELWTIHGGTHYPEASHDGESSDLAERIVAWLLTHPKP